MITSLANSLDACLNDLKALSIKAPSLQAKPISLELGEMVKEYCTFLAALKSCRKVAENETAKVIQQKVILEKLRVELEELRHQVDDLGEAPKIKTEKKESSEECDIILHDTLNQYSEAFRKMLRGIEEEMNRLKEEMRDFKVVLFGRTKVGKSTVREALTQGNGETIGKGGQSTTIEIHKYNWFNLQVYDTPGILSTKDTGKDEHGIGDEERMAADLLARADIALFMFSSDNIESAEREYLRTIASQSKDELRKNILVLLNVKSDISDYRMFKLRHKERELEPSFQDGNLRRIKEVLPEGSNVQILPVHAQAAYYSRAKGDPKVSDFYFKNQVEPDELYALSHFAKIREYMVMNIQSKGNWIRRKTIWGVFIRHLRTLAQENRAPIENTRKTIQDIYDRIKLSKEKVQRIIKKHSEALYDKMLDLAKERIDTYEYARQCIEGDYDKSSINKGWDAQIKKLEDLPEIVIKDFLNEIQQVLEEMTYECQFTVDCASKWNIGIVNDIDWNKWFKAAGLLTGISSSILFVFAAANIWNPGGWIGGLAGLSLALKWLAGLFKSKQGKIDDLNKELNKDLEERCSKVANNIKSYCENGTPEKKGEPAKPGLFTVIHKHLDDAMKRQMRMLDLCERFLCLNDVLLQRADEYERELTQEERGTANGVCRFSE